MLDFRKRLRRVARELAKFGSVGAIAFVINFGLFNLLHAQAGAGLGPLTANGLATVVATTFAYFANRYWTFRHRDRTGLGREYALFFGLNAVGLVITELFLGFGHYVLSMTGPLATNGFLVVGTGFATLFRYWAYRRWVFLAPAPAAPAAAPLFEPVVRATGAHPALARSSDLKRAR
ncbi:MAG: GtrA family protein [Streptosporangiaceae bacterium]